MHSSWIYLAIIMVTTSIKIYEEHINLLYYLSIVKVNVLIKMYMKHRSRLLNAIMQFHQCRIGSFLWWCLISCLPLPSLPSRHVNGIVENFLLALAHFWGHKILWRNNSIWDSIFSHQSASSHSNYSTKSFWNKRSFHISYTFKGGNLFSFIIWLVSIEHKC